VRSSSPKTKRQSALVGKLPPLVTESKSDRALWTVVAGIIIVGFFLALHQYWLPATAGPDQNGYLVGGKFFARTFSTGFKPDNPYAFVGREWIEAKGRYFPKYPLGLSVLYAITLKLGGLRFGIPLTFMVNPIAMALALLAIFLFVRDLLGSFLAVLAILLVATSPVCTGLTNTPNSHATAICCVAWGFFLLFRWWQRNGIARGICAGLLIGSAATIRYTEGMLILPVLIVVLLNFRKEDRRSWIESAFILAAWAVPVAILASYNWVSMHHLTGYDTTNESTGFTLAGFEDNWEIMLRELYNTGLFFTLPLTLFGAVMMFRWNWRVSLVIAAWAVPNLLLYTCYYWAPDGAGIGYLRFTLTVFPALALATVYGLKWISEHAGGDRLLPMLAVTILIALGCAVNLNTALTASETEAGGDRNLLTATAAILNTVPAHAVLFVSDDELFSLEQFDIRRVEQYANVDPSVATAGLQAQRADEIYDRVKGLPAAQMNRELVREQNQLMIDELHQGKRVFFITPVSRRGEVNRLVPRNVFSSTVLTSWDEQNDFKTDKKPHWLGLKGTPPPEPRRSSEWQVIEIKLLPPPPKAVKPKPPANTRPIKKRIKPAT
jgi:4-amino-4-deoxy-L-arabinose transferase-like glycosyltransferase